MMSTPGSQSDSLHSVETGGTLTASKHKEKAVYTSAIGRLQAMPAVFKGSDLARAFGWNTNMTSVYLAQWKSRQLVAALGGRSDVYFNLIVERVPHLERGLFQVYPQAVRVGLQMLTAAGWSTQIQHGFDLAITDDTKVFSVEGVVTGVRTNEWFSRAGIEDRTAGVLMRLRPAWALADMWARSQDRRAKAWLPDPDDLDWDAIAGAGKKIERDWAAASEAFGLRHAELNVDSYGAAFAVWDQRRRALQARSASSGDGLTGRPGVRRKA